MVSFRTLATVALAVFAAPVIAQSGVVDSFKLLTQKSQTLQTNAMDLTIGDQALLLVSGGPLQKVVDGMDDLSSEVTNLIHGLSLSPPPGSVRLPYQDFMRVTQLFIDTLDSKTGLYQTLPLANPLVSSIKKLVRNIDTLSSVLEDKTRIPTFRIYAAYQKFSNPAIKSYSGTPLLGNVIQLGRVKRAARAALIAA